MNVISELSPLYVCVCVCVCVHTCIHNLSPMWFSCPLPLISLVQDGAVVHVAYTRVGNLPRLVLPWVFNVEISR